MSRAEPHRLTLVRKDGSDYIVGDFADYGDAWSEALTALKESDEYSSFVIAASPAGQHRDE